jgi:DNA-binding NarL/FixJ family response regulator
MDLGSSDSAEVRARVLLVDDSAAFVTLVARVVQQEFKVTGVLSDAESLLAAWPTARADVIVLDISLPGQNGLEAAARLRMLGCRAHIIFLSVHEAPDIVNAAWGAGGVGYVAKRDLGADLLPAIRAALRGERFVSAAIGAQ